MQEFRLFNEVLLLPATIKKIILFVTQDKPRSATPYHDHLSGNLLEWDGPNDHFAEQRMLDTDQTGDEIHLFYRQTSRESFTYYGKIQLLEIQRYTDQPSRSLFRLFQDS